MISYLALQFRFLFLGLVEKLGTKNEKIPAIPSPRLRYRVHGSTEPYGYIEVGKLSWKSIEKILANLNRPIDGFENILDFGCGTGRVLRNIPNRDQTNIWGIDIDSAAIQWCQEHLPGARFEHIDSNPPTHFDRESLDLIFSISVFTHLDERRQDQWLEEMSRLLRPGGILIASVHGDYHRELHSREVDMKSGFVFNDSKRRFFKKDGLPQFYQDAHHTKQYVMESWSRYFTIIDYVERGIVDHHDAVVLTKKRPA
jgi:SAM-dependent methyltransferase